MISYFLTINTFSAQLLFRRSFFTRVTNYLEHVLFRSRCFIRTAALSEEELFRSTYFFKTATFSDSSAQPISWHFTWKDFPLISIHSFKYAIVRSHFEIPQSFIAQNSKQSIKFQYRVCYKCDFLGSR